MSKFLGIFQSIGLLLLGSIISFLVYWYWIVRGEKVKAAEKLAAATTKLEARVVELEGKLSLLNQTVLPLSTAFQNILIERLTHYHTPEMDALLKKIGPPNELTEQDELDLAEGLKRRTTDMGKEISDSERTAAEMLPLVIKFSKEQAQDIASKEIQLKIVAVAATGGENGKA